AWFLRACHRDREQRFATAAEQVEALAEALGLSKLGGGATLPGAATTAPIRASARRPVAVAGLAAGVAALALAGLFVYRGAGGKGAGAVPAAAVPLAPVARQQPDSLRETAKPLETPPPKTEGAVVEAAVPPSTNREEAGRPRRRRVPGARPGVDAVASPP